jgi:hypothetical protein
MNIIEKEIERMFEHFDDIAEEQPFDFFCEQEEVVKDIEHNEREWRV